jgi:hypothetical protein
MKRRVILESLTIRFPKGWEISVPAGVIAITAVAIAAALAALGIREVVRRVNRRDDPRRAKPPSPEP